MSRSRQWATAGLDGGPHPVDLHVGSRLRAYRLAIGGSQTALAVALGVTSQQVLKYETGRNRISASRLKLAADALGVPISYFFTGLEPSAEPTGDEQLVQEEILDLIRFYYLMPEAARRGFWEMLQSVAGSAQPAEIKGDGGPD